MSKIAFLFPGQGSQYVGMGQEYCKEFAVARQVFQEANDTFGFDFQKICFEGSSVELNQIENVLPAILTVSVAAFRVYMQEVGVVPHFAAGHSLGEYAALTCSGALSFSDTLKIVKLRSILAVETASKVDGAMTVINEIQPDIIVEQCRKVSRDETPVFIACYNSANQTVISGHQTAVMQVEDILMEMGAQITPILMSPPFHGPLLRPVMEKLKNELLACGYGQLQWPVVSNVTALPYESVTDIINNLVLQLVKPVQWMATLDYLTGCGVTVFLEIGPQSVLTDLIKTNGIAAKSFSFGQRNERQALLDCLTSREMETQPKKSRSYAVTLVTKCLAAAVSTKNKNWNNDEYYRNVVAPFQEIQAMQQKLQETNSLPTMRQMREALQMLRSVLRTKQVPLEIQVKKFQQILNETGTGDLFPEFINPTSLGT